jgi:hypothetical protein
MGAGGTAAGYVISHLVEPCVRSASVRFHCALFATERGRPRTRRPHSRDGSHCCRHTGETGREPPKAVVIDIPLHAGGRDARAPRRPRSHDGSYHCLQARDVCVPSPGARAPAMGHTTACRRETSAYPVQAPALPRWVIPLPAGARRLRTQSRRPRSRDGSHCCRHTGETGREPPKAVVIDIPLHAGGRDARAPRPCSDAHRIWCQAVSAVNTR